MELRSTVDGQRIFIFGDYETKHSFSVFFLKVITITSTMMKMTL